MKADGVRRTVADLIGAGNRNRRNFGRQKENKTIPVPNYSSRQASDSRSPTPNHCSQTDSNIDGTATTHCVTVTDTVHRLML